MLAFQDYCSPLYNRIILRQRFLQMGNIHIATGRMNPPSPSLFHSLHFHHWNFQSAHPKENKYFQSNTSSQSDVSPIFHSVRSGDLVGAV